MIIVSSPVYNGTFTAPVKAIIDRFQFYYTSFYKNGKVQAIKKHRKALLVAAAGRSGVEALGYMEKQLKCAFTILNMELAGSVLCSDTDTDPDIEKAKSEFVAKYGPLKVTDVSDNFDWVKGPWPWEVEANVEL